MASSTSGPTFGYAPAWSEPACLLDRAETCEWQRRRRALPRRPGSGLEESRLMHIESHQGSRPHPKPGGTASRRESPTRCTAFPVRRWVSSQLQRGARSMSGSGGTPGFCLLDSGTAFPGKTRSSTTNIRFSLCRTDDPQHTGLPFLVIPSVAPPPGVPRLKVPIGHFSRNPQARAQEQVPRRPGGCDGGRRQKSRLMKR